MLGSIPLIQRNNEGIKGDLNDLTDRVLILEDQADKSGNDIHNIQQQLRELQFSNKVLTGRLIRAEIKIQQQEDRIQDLISRSMRDNLVIKTTGDEYKEMRDEDTSYVVKKFLAKEMRVTNVEGIAIIRALS